MVCHTGLLTACKQDQDGTSSVLHLVGFIIRIYHDARSPERQIRNDENKFTSILKSSIVQNIIISRLQHISALHTTDGTDEAANSVAAGGDVVESSQFAHITISEQQTATSSTAVPPFSRSTETVVKK